MSEIPIRFSYEIFPPKTEEALSRLRTTLSVYDSHRPGFISVTCGAGGSTNANNVSLCREVSQRLRSPCIPHITCSGMTKNAIRERLELYSELGIRSLLVLRGDKVDRQTDDFVYAADLARFVTEHFPTFSVLVAGYPEGHNQNSDPGRDFDYQFAKAQSYADGVITQLFFDNQFFKRYTSRMNQRGYRGEIMAGIFIISEYKQILKLTQLCKTRLPEGLLQRLERFKSCPRSIKQCGIEYATQQITELRSWGQTKFHLYVMNQSESVAALRTNLNLFP